MQAMRRCVLWLVAAGCLASLEAQSPLTTSMQSNYYLASHDGAVYFDLTVQNELQIDRLDLNLHSPLGTNGTIEVLVRPGTWLDHVQEPGDWVVVASGACVAAGVDQPSPCWLSAPIGLPPGHYGIALHCVGVMPNYNFAFGLRSFANADLTLTGGGSAMQCLQTPPFVYRVFSGSLHYTVGGGPYAVGAADRFGEGCHQGARSFYEWFAPGGFDLAHRRLVLTPNAHGGYDVSAGTAAPITISPLAVNLGLGRGGAAFVPLPTPLAFPGGSTTQLLVCADGRVMLSEEGLLGSLSSQPNAPALFSGRPTIAVAWMDLVPLLAANVYAHVDASTGTTTVVWSNLPTFGSPAGPGSTFSFSAHANGVLELCYGTVQQANDATLIGFGAGLGARDPGALDVSMRLPFATEHEDPGLSLQAVGRPVLGTAPVLQVRDLPPSTLGTALVFGWNALVPGFLLSSFGAPDCAVYVDPIAVRWLGGSAAPLLAMPIPADAALLGVRYYAQGLAVDVGANALGLLTSNALSLSIGGV